MTALEEVYAVIVLLYLLESLLVVGSGQIVLRESLLGRWSIVVNGFELAGINRRVVVGPLLPAGGAVVVDAKEFEILPVFLASTQSETETVDFDSRFRGLKRVLEPIELLSNTLAAFLFVGFPLEVRVLGLDAAWPIILGQLIVLMALTTLLVRISSRRMLRSPLRFGDIAAMAVSPFAAIRAPRVLWGAFFADSPSTVLCLLGLGDHPVRPPYVERGSNE